MFKSVPLKGYRYYIGKYCYIKIEKANEKEYYFSLGIDGEDYLCFGVPIPGNGFEDLNSAFNDVIFSILYPYSIEFRKFLKECYPVEEYRDFLKGVRLVAKAIDKGKFLKIE